MKKILVLLVLVAGCGEATYNRYKTPEQYALAYEKKRAMAIDAFKTMYPENWEQELLKYDLQQERVQREQQAFCHQQEILNRQRDQKEFLGLWQFFQQQRMYDAQYDYYTRPYEVGGVIHVP